jgi:hypothetical protein
MAPYMPARVANVWFIETRCLEHPRDQNGGWCPKGLHDSVGQYLGIEPKRGSQNVQLLRPRTSGAIVRGIRSEDLLGCADVHPLLTRIYEDRAAALHRPADSCPTRISSGRTRPHCFHRG